MMKRDPANIIRSFIAHKKLIYIIVASFVAVGVVGLFFIKKDEFPSFEIKQGLVAGIYPGASASQVEDQLTRPLEDILFSFTEVSRENTYSYSRDGVCYIFVDLTVPARKKDEAWSKIKLKLESSRMTLPPGVLAVTVLDDFSSVSSLLIAIESPDKGYSELLDYAEDLRSSLLEIPEMAAVSILGAQTEEIAVDVDMDRLSSYGISPASLLVDYQTAGLQVPGGTFSTGYVNSPIHITSPLASEQEVAEHIIYSDPAGNVVRLGDVAEVHRQYKEPSSLVNYNGRSAVVLSVEKRLDNDIVAFGAKVNKVLDSFSETLPESVTISRITDQPKVVGNSVLSFLRDLVISMLVVILVMLYNLIGEVAFDNSLRDMEPEGCTRFLADILALIVGLEFVKLLTRQRAVDLIEVMQLAVARQMIVEHLSMKEIIIGVTAIAILFAARKYLFLKESEAKELHEDF